MRDRVKFLSGNFLTDSLPTADVLIMGHILHDWDLSQKRMLLEKAYAALPTAERSLYTRRLSMTHGAKTLSVC
jgi:hypothetical protein